MSSKKINLSELKKIVNQVLKENDEGQGNLSYEGLVDLYEKKFEKEKLSVKNYMENWFDNIDDNISWTLGCIDDSESHLQELAQEVSKGNYLMEDFNNWKNDLDKEKQKLHEIIPDMDALDLFARIGDVRGNEWRTGEGYFGKIFMEADSLRERIIKEVQYAKGSY